MSVSIHDYYIKHILNCKKKIFLITLFKLSYYTVTESVETAELKIVRISNYNCSTKGGEEIWLLVNNVAKGFLILFSR